MLNDLGRPSSPGSYHYSPFPRSPHSYPVSRGAFPSLLPGLLSIPVLSPSSPQLAALHVCRDGPKAAWSIAHSVAETYGGLLMAFAALSMFTEAVVGKVCHFQRFHWQAGSLNCLVLLPQLLRIMKHSHLPLFLSR